MRAQVCASQPTREIADVVVFDGAPANGNVVAWKRVFVADGKQCDYTWLEWVPLSAVTTLWWQKFYRTRTTRSRAKIKHR